MLSTRRARSASGCRRRSLGVATTSASCARRGGTCWEMVAVARFYRRHFFRTAVRSGYLLLTTAAAVRTAAAWTPGTTVRQYLVVRGTYGLRIIRKKLKCLFLPKAAHKIKILHWISYKEVKRKWSHKQERQKGTIFEPKKILHNKRPNWNISYTSD